MKCRKEIGVIKGYYDQGSFKTIGISKRKPGKSLLGIF